MAERREDLRAADADREAVAHRLKGALNEGRLTLSEYDERLRDAYGSKTYGELDSVLADLPGVHPAAHSQLAPMTPAPHPVGGVGSTGTAAIDHSIPGWLAKVWGAWAVAVFVNLVIWVLVSVSADDGPVYFWPMWVAGPWGAVLLATTVSGLVTGAPNRAKRRRSAQR